MIRYGTYFTWQDKQGNINTECNRACDLEGCALTLPTFSLTKVAIPCKEGQFVLKEEIKCEQVATLQGGKWDKMHDIAKRVYGTNGISPTLHTCGGGNLEPKIMEENRFYKQAFETVKENDCEVGDTVDAFNKKLNDSGVCPTVTTRPEGFKTAILVVDEPLVYDGFNRQVRADQTTAGCLTRNVGADLKRNGQGIIEPLTTNFNDIASTLRASMHKQGTRNLMENIKNGRGYEGVIEHTTESKYRVRKLTERECFKLMGVKVEDFSKIRRNQSKSSCYHLAGDSIVSTVLMALFGQMLNIDWKEKVNKLVGEIVDV